MPVLACAQAVAQIQAEASQTPIDVVLYIDRSDLYRVESADHEVLFVHGRQSFTILTWLVQGVLAEKALAKS
jgi:hypothetical protein